MPSIMLEYTKYIVVVKIFQINTSKAGLRILNRKVKIGGRAEPSSQIALGGGLLLQP